VIVLVARRFSTYKVPVEIVPPVLLITTLEAEKLEILSAMNCDPTVNCEIPRLVVVKFVARTLSAYKTPVLIVLAMIALILRYPPAGAYMLPLKKIVDAAKEEV
jgi:hypothetical protein